MILMAKQPQIHLGGNANNSFCTIVCLFQYFKYSTFIHSALSYFAEYFAIQFSKLCGALQKNSVGFPTSRINKNMNNLHKNKMLTIIFRCSYHFVHPKKKVHRNTRKCSTKTLRFLVFVFTYVNVIWRKINDYLQFTQIRPNFMIFLFCFVLFCFKYC